MTINSDLTRRRILATALALPFFGPARAQAQSSGRYIGTVVTEWLPDSRRMKLVQPFEFIDTLGRRWPVPSGTVVDGASIPQVFWSLIGGPFEGRYRGPSVIHDYFCEIRTRPSSVVHRNFHEGMLVSGVRASLALLMYKAVDAFGPQWADPKIDPRCEIFGEDYDFDYCARNTAKPIAFRPAISRAKLNDFANDLEGQVDPQDLLALRTNIEATP
jgi:hypothetical protein